MLVAARSPARRQQQPARRDRERMPGYEAQRAARWWAGQPELRQADPEAGGGRRERKRRCGAAPRRQAG